MMAPSSETPKPILSRPARLVLAWVLVILIGAVLLRLPASARDEPLDWLDALFTATSAVCITGLSTITVSEQLSGFGQAVLLILIQLGGLGIVTVSTLLLLAVGQVSLSSQSEARSSLVAIRIKPLHLLGWVAATTLVIEALGALALGMQFTGPQAGWEGIFHSVSAFCNSGFSLYPDSLVRYHAQVGVNVTVALLIMLGGVGFVVLYQLARWSFSRGAGRRYPLSLHARAVLWGSVGLWVFGAVAFLVLGWSASLDGLAPGEKVMAAGFQSVTTRTAGFNTIAFTDLRQPTLLLTMLLMFAGGAPGSCAGGVKLTTMLVALATLRAHCRGEELVTMLKRTVPREVVQRAFQLLTLAVLFVVVILVALLLTEEQLELPDPRADHFTCIAFEVVSAFGTVGLSTGITPLLSPAGKLLIIITMFVGRLGPLLVALAVFRARRAARFEYPKEELAIG